MSNKLNKKVEITVNNKKIKAEEKENLLNFLIKKGFKIPFLCHHLDLKSKKSCQLCLVEVDGKMVTACTIKIRKGIKVKTNSSQIKKIIKNNLETIFGLHREECYDCVWRFNCKLLELAREYQADMSKFKDRKTKCPVYSFNDILEFDSSKCIECLNCVEVCQNQGVGFLEIKNKKKFHKIAPSRNKKIDCVYCGQCILHCPVGAFESTGEFEKIEEPFLEKDKIKVVQIAPAVRASIGEEFGLSYDSLTMQRIVGSLKKIGADYVFDVSSGADFTTIEESKEFIERISHKKQLPMMTSCCPSWVKFIEFFYPEFIPNLTSVRSPHIIMGGLIKNYWAKKRKINPEKVSVISIMPCISKKYEIRRKELKTEKVMPVDYVLTVRELVRLIKKRKIDFKNVKPENLDDPFGNPSGAGVIYGSSGGVMESALKMSIKMMNYRKKVEIDFKKDKNREGIKKAEIEIKNSKLKVAVVSGLGNARKILNEIKKSPLKYDYIEVMACPGGCIGGGGQPVPSNSEIKKKRTEVLRSIGSESIRKMPDENPSIKKIYKEYLKNKETIKKICHTKYKKINKQKYEKIN